MVKANHALSNSALFASVLSRFDNVLGQFAVDRLFRQTDSNWLERAGVERKIGATEKGTFLPSFLFYAFPRRACLAVLARSLGACL